ncbi:multi antimicrobial extrusion protein MatE [Saccharibacillus sp. CPCC 101409]|uniref:multi antimicrobial extrusion protein MatE n=1 Tax=Saccharibacillus sp. CPCC 101409 TaxID=3058041 RepID=UPI0026738EA9|nr:multi antimicrobial extrusion protein MatE [Saccharibacillus sp. CPCC 101409]MDO3410913.1 multi antimicrobial extrusion protein MatE [Saccharibacillus sp. CPCC 101409]
MSEEPLSWKRLLTFFVPLGLSASLVTFSHVIINRTLASAVSPETVIASYAIASSLLSITERPSTLLRQTCSALVRDKISFRSLTFVTYVFLVCVMLIGFLIAYTPIGHAIFGFVFGVDRELLPKVLTVYSVLMFVSVFSVIRNIYQGIIITNNRTKWLTIGMIIRLAGMYLMSLYFLHIYGVNSGVVGAVIFVGGMVIEASVSFFEGRNIARNMPLKKAGHPIETRGDIFRFYKPLLYSALVAMFIGPALNIMLGKTEGVALAISAFAVAGSLMQLMLSFFLYIHQIVLNYYRIDPVLVRKFALAIGFIPVSLVAAIAYTPLGYWVFGHVMNVEGVLLEESLRTLRAFILYPLVMPWLDYGNGLILLGGQTKVMLRSQLANAICTIAALFLLVALFPHWNGIVGALAQSLGLLAEASIIFLVLRRMGREPKLDRPAG